MCIRDSASDSELLHMITKHPDMFDRLDFAHALLNGNAAFNLSLIHIYTAVRYTKCKGGEAMREKKDINIEIGGNIQVAREQAGYTQDTFAPLYICISYEQKR